MERMATTLAMLSTPDTTRRRRRRSSGDGDHDDAALDEMLEQLGIPNSGGKSKTKKTRRGTDETEVAAGAVIELVTPPRALRPVANTRDCGDDESSACLAVTLDLTTPTPPQQAKPRTTKRASIVNLLSPDSQSETSSQSELQWSRGSEHAGPTLEHPAQVHLLERLDAADTAPPEILDPIAPACTTVPRSRLTGPTLPSQGLQRLYDAASSDLLPLSARLAAAAAAPLRPRPESTSVSRRDLDEQASEDEVSAPIVQGKPKKRARKKREDAPPRPTKERIVPAIAMEQQLADSDAGRGILKALVDNAYMNKPVPFVAEPAFDSLLRVIQWERRGGSTDAEPLGPSLSNRYAIAMHCPAESCVELFVDKGYECLRHIVNKVKRMPLCLSSPRVSVEWGTVVVIVEGMDRALIQRKKEGKKKKKTTSGTAPQRAISFSDLHELAFQLFMDTEAHTKFTCDSEATASYVALFTRELVVAATRQSSQEEFLESVPRVHSFRVLPNSGSTLNAFANTWLRMLQMIPGVSEDRAQSILDHFPTFESLLRAYEDPTRTLEEKQNLLADKLHGSRIENALSRRIFNVFNGRDATASV